MKKHDPRKGVRGELHSKAKLDWGKVRYIRANEKLPKWQRIDQKALARRFGVSVSTVSQVVNNRTWKDASETNR